MRPSNPRLGDELKPLYANTFSFLFFLLTSYFADIGEQYRGYVPVRCHLQ